MDSPVRDHIRKRRVAAKLLHPDARSMLSASRHAAARKGCAREWTGRTGEGSRTVAHLPGTADRLLHQPFLFYLNPPMADWHSTPGRTWCLRIQAAAAAGAFQISMPDGLGPSSTVTCAGYGPPALRRTRSSDQPGAMPGVGRDHVGV